jgi:hypothetical protein
MLDREHSTSKIGFAVYPQEDKKNLLKTYSYKFTGF